MQNFTTLIVDMVKQERLLAPQGGPIIITQVRTPFPIIIFLFLLQSFQHSIIFLDTKSLHLLMWLK